MLETLNQLPGVITAVVEGIDSEDRPLVRWAGWEQPQAVCGVLWQGQPIDWAGCRGLRVAIAFEEGDESRPVLLGLLETPPRPQDQAVVTAGASAEEQEPDVPDVVHIKGEKELVLECGKAKIALRADGRVKIMGGYVLSRSTGVNKIKGASVHVN